MTRRNAFSDIGALFDERGNLKPIHTLPAEVRSTIASVEVIVKNAAGGDGHTDVVHKVKALGAKGQKRSSCSRSISRCWSTASSSKRPRRSKIDLHERG